MICARSNGGSFRASLARIALSMPLGYIGDLGMQVSEAVEDWSQPPSG